MYKENSRMSAEWRITMNRRVDVKKNNEHCYDIVINQGFDAIADELERLNITGIKLCIVTDSNVGPIYADQLKAILEKTGNSVYVFTIPAGEANKNLNVVQTVYTYLIEEHFERRDMIVALGGGVVGDLAGFTAATYLRGIDFIQVPTSLLAQVDSSIGGKTGVDFAKYKNMVGAFHMPRLVYINIDTLSTLSVRLFNSGFGEIIKHGLIKNREYFDYLDTNYEHIKALEPEYIMETVYQSCIIKADVVNNDPTEKGERALLNFGHTLGHAVEKLMNFSLYHGECVALGMICASYISKERGYITEDDYTAIRNMLKKYGFPTKVEGLDIFSILEVSKSDKKMENGVVKFILLKQLGEAVIDKTVTYDEMTQALKEIL